MVIVQRLESFDVICLSWMFLGIRMGVWTLANATLTVIGVLILRAREPDLSRPFTMPWYPLPMVAYSVIILWTLIYLVTERPVEGLMALALMTLGGFVYWGAQRQGTRQPTSERSGT